VTERPGWQAKHCGSAGGTVGHHQRRYRQVTRSRKPRPKDNLHATAQATA